MELEFAIDPGAADAPYSMALRPNPDSTAQAGHGWAPRWILDWEPAVEALLADRVGVAYALASILAWAFEPRIS